MKKEYQKPEIEIINFEMEAPIADGSGVDNYFPLDGDVMEE